MLQQLSDDLLLEAYDRAIQHCLNADFISIIKQELRRRGLLKHIHMKKRSFLVVERSSLPTFLWGRLFITLILFP